MFQFDHFYSNEITPADVTFSKYRKNIYIQHSELEENNVARNTWRSPCWYVLFYGGDGLVLNGKSFIPTFKNIWLVLFALQFKLKVL
jgi:hypothetical protein